MVDSGERNMEHPTGGCKCVDTLNTVQGIVNYCRGVAHQVDVRVQRGSAAVRMSNIDASMRAEQRCDGDSAR